MATYSETTKTQLLEVLGCDRKDATANFPLAAPAFDGEISIDALSQEAESMLDSAVVHDDGYGKVGELKARGRC